MKKLWAVLILCSCTMALSGCLLRDTGPCYGSGCPSFMVSKSPQPPAAAKTTAQAAPAAAPAAAAETAPAPKSQDSAAITKAPANANSAPTTDAPQQQNTWARLMHFLKIKG